MASPRAAARAPKRGTASMSLLGQLVDQAVDRDYFAVRRPPGPPPTLNRPLAVAVLMAFGILLGLAAIVTERAAPLVADERAELVSRIDRGSAAVDVLQRRIEDLRGALRTQRGVLAATTVRRAALEGQVGQLGLSTGSAAAIGPGLRVVLDDAPFGTAPGDRGEVVDADLRQLVNGLWEAGAEAVAINGHRLSNLSAIRGAGEAITVNFRSLTPPYVVDAVGDPDALPARLLDTTAGQTLLDLSANFGLRFEISTEEDLSVPPDPRLERCCSHAGPVVR